MDTRNAYLLDSQSGHFVSGEHQRIAEIINDYDSEMTLVWIPPENRNLNEEFPFAIMHTMPDGHTYVVRKVREREVNEELVAWLWTNDLAKQGVTKISLYLESLENAKKAVKLKREIEEAKQRKDFWTSVLEGPNYYRHNGKTLS
jgi:hypothetical protein